MENRNLLNFDVFNGTNKFEYNNTKNAPALYGFTDEIYIDENGYEIIADGLSKSNGVYYVFTASGLNTINKMFE